MAMRFMNGPGPSGLLKQCEYHMLPGSLLERTKKPEELAILSLKALFKPLGHKRENPIMQF